MEDFEHRGGSLFLVRVSEALCHGLVIHRVIVVDHLFRHLKQKQRGFIWAQPQTYDLLLLPLFKLKIVSSVSKLFLCLIGKKDTTKRNTTQ